jgi:hypothetical protein
MEVLHDSKGVINDNLRRYFKLGSILKKANQITTTENVVFLRMGLDLDGTRLKTPSEKYCCVEFFLRRL